MEKFVEQHPNGGGVRELTGRESPKHTNDSLVIAVQIDTKSALDSVKEIAAVPGIDVLLLGSSIVARGAFFAVNRVLYRDCKPRIVEEEAT